MGAGDRGGPECCRQARQGGSQERNEQQFRHEHAADEQRVRYGDVAQRGVISPLNVPALSTRRGPQQNKAAHGPLFHGLAQAAASAR